MLELQIVLSIILGGKLESCHEDDLKGNANGNACTCKGCIWYMLLPIISWGAFHSYLSVGTLEAAGATK